MKMTLVVVGEKVKYGIFEENSGKFWGEVYSILAEPNINKH